MDSSKFSRRSLIKGTAAAGATVLGATDLLQFARAWAQDALAHLDFLGMAGHAQDYGGELSYAEQKLVMFACLMASGATTLLLDEPTAGLDPSSHLDMIETVTRLRRPGATVVLIEHNLDIVRGCCDRVVFLAEGAVKAVGTTEEVEHSPELRDLYFGTGGAA